MLLGLGPKVRPRPWGVAKIGDLSVLTLPTNSKVLIKSIKSRTTKKNKIIF